MLRIYNTLSRQLEDFIPIKAPHVGVYTCGPTVYDYMHIGNLRTFVFSDLLTRVLLASNYEVKSVMNITDIDDKIIERATKRNISIYDLAKEYTTYFLRDVEKLNILPKDEMPKATLYIDKIKKFIQDLLDKGYAYIEKDGSIYFDISKFKDYGNLSRIDKSALKTGMRVLSDDYTKEDAEDFALWKAVPKTEVGFDSSWGWGRPGWHIECSVMSEDTLGQPFDVHAGGIDLIFPHHENEIAQSEARSGKKLANYFIHGAHMLVDGKKMSKSLNNFYTLEDVRSRGFDPLSLRYLYLQTHYRQEMNFTWESLTAAQNAISKLRRHYGSAEGTGSKVPQEFYAAINDDLNFPKALSAIWENINTLSRDSLDEIDKVLGLGLSEYKENSRVVFPPEVQKLLEKREHLRKEGKFEEADEIRNEIVEMGYNIEDK
jgi:cysteinyl-tRNA synthetase